MIKTPPRAWQSACLRAWEDHGCRGIARVATGAGKTLFALMAAEKLAQRFPGDALRVKIVVPTIFLATQWRADILRELDIAPENVGLYHGQIKENPDRPFMIYVVNTARNSLARHVLRESQAGHAVFLICDECHHMNSPENRRTFAFFPHIEQERYFSLGLSATPSEESPAALGTEFYRYDIADASREGIVSKYVRFSIALDFSKEESAEFAYFTEKILLLRNKLLQAYPKLKNMKNRDFLRVLHGLSSRGDEVGELAVSLSLLYIRRKEVSHTAKARIACTRDILRVLLPDKRAIVFAERIETVDALYEILREEYPGRVGRYHSKLAPEVKAAALARYRQGEHAVLLCCRALDEGLNIPDTDAGIVLSSTGNERQRIQRLGRILRLREGRKCLYYLHIPESGEPDALLPDDALSCVLRYEQNIGFMHFAYDKLASRVLRNMRDSGASGTQLSTAMHWISMGQLRAGFLLAPEKCEEYAKSAPNRQKDYWICMTLLSRERIRQSNVNSVRQQAGVTLREE